jgi:hypothetical protein
MVPSFPGYYLYYPSRKQPFPSVSLVVDAVRINRKNLTLNYRANISRTDVNVRFWH